jgi:hypothetical protein
VHIGARIASVAFALAIFALVFEMVRRRHLRERYAILWLGAALVLLVLAAWSQLLGSISRAVGIATPSNAFFVIAFSFLLLLVLHFSAVVSKLADESRVLAQRLSLLEQRHEESEQAASGPRAHEDVERSGRSARSPEPRTRAGSKP